MATALFAPVDTLDDFDFDITIGEASSTDMAKSQEAGDIGLVLPVYEPTVYTIRFVPLLRGLHKVDLLAKQNEVDYFRSWANHVAEKQVEARAIENPESMKDAFAIGVYHAKVIAKVYSTYSPWLAKNQDVNNYKTLNILSRDFRKDLIELALAGFAIPDGATKSLGQVLDSITESITSATSKKHKSGVSYWIQFVIYDFDPDTEGITARIRTISFMTTEDTHEITEYCQASKKLDLKVLFTGNDSSFNFEIFKEARPAIALQMGKSVVTAVDGVKNLKVEVDVY